MSATDETLVLRPAETPDGLAQGAEGGRSSGRAPTALPAPAEGIELLGDVHGSGYEAGAALVRRADGQVVQLGTLLYALLESLDGERTTAELADLMCERLGRPCDEEHVVALAQKLADQGLLAGHEHNAPPRRNPLLALRWKVLVTDPKWTSRLTAPFTFLYRPFILWPVVAGFLGVCWFVLFHKGIASATRDAMNKPALLVLVFALALLSAGFHELGHAAATRYGGATPGGMGVGLYLVWPAFYTDVTDAYRLPRRDRLRVDFGGLYFNAIVSVVTLGVWELWRHDALLLLIGLQLLMMVKNLSPVIRSDGYHVLADATGIPDLYAHIGPTLRRLLPWKRREPSALTGRARLLVTLWVLIVTPVLIAMLLGAVLLLPRLITTAWDSGHVIAARIPHQGALGVLASCLQLFALSLPAVGSILVTQRLVRGALAKGWLWSDGRPVRRALVVVAATGVACSAGWAWWPSGQYMAIQPYEHGTLAGFIQSPTAVARPVDPVRVVLTPGRHLAVAMIPVGGATKAHPAFFFLPGRDGRPGIGILTVGGRSTAFPFQLPGPPGPGDTQALAVNTTDGTVVYKVAYAVITVQDGAPVTNTNGAYAIASCRACAAVAVSFQVVLVVGTSTKAAPIDAAAAVNYDCPSCLSVALANQIVVTLSSQPTDELIQKLQAALQQLDATSSLTSAAAITDLVQQVQKQIDSMLQQSGQVATSTTQTAPAATTATTTTTRSTTTAAAATTTAATTTTEQATTTATTTAATTTETTPTTTTTP